MPGLSFPLSFPLTRGGGPLGKALAYPLPWADRNLENAVLAAFNRIKNLPNLEAFYAPYIPGVTPNFTSATTTGFASAWLDSSGKGRNLVQASGAAQPSVPGDGSLLFNGTAQVMQALFTFAQPCSIISCQKEIAWTAGRRLYDGGNVDSMLLYETSSTPNKSIFAGAQLAPSFGSPAVGAMFTSGAVYDGVSSSIQFDAGAVTTGDAGTAVAGGITIGAGASGNFSNTKYAGLIASSAHLTQPQILQAIADLNILKTAAGIS